MFTAVPRTARNNPESLIGARSAGQSPAQPAASISDSDNFTLQNEQLMDDSVFYPNSEKEFSRRPKRKGRQELSRKRRSSPPMRRPARGSRPPGHTGKNTNKRRQITRQCPASLRNPCQPTNCMWLNARRVAI